MARFIFFSEKVPQILIFWGSIMCVAPGSLWADPTPVDIRARIEDQEAKKRVAERKLLETREKMDMLVEDEAPIIREIEDLNVQINTLQDRIRALRVKIKQLDKKMALSKEKRDRLLGEIREQEAYASKRLVAFYKLCRLGVAPILFSGTSLLNTQQRIITLERILGHDAHTRKSFQNKKDSLDLLLEKMGKQKKTHKDLLARCDKDASVMAEKRVLRGQLLKKIQTEKRLTRDAVLAYKQSVKELDLAVRSLRQQMVGPEIAPGNGPFFAQKGALPLPTQGDLVAFFGAYENDGPYNTKGFRNGINIKASPGEPVRAVWNGQVVYSDWFKGYGNIVIIDHGAHYYSLSAQLDQVFAKKGDLVRGGETVGTVGDTATHGGPGLYFEIRHRGKPQDPVPWFRQ